jgi:hypothetical protein
VPLKFNDLVVTSMLRGKKVMHLLTIKFEYLPGETVVIPSVEMKIDFLKPQKNLPQCLALAIDQQKINDTPFFK